MVRFTLGLVFCFSGLLSGQSTIFQTYLDTDGLPDNTVTCVRQSNDGLIWIGTTNGLSRFDGIRFKNYQAGRPPHNLSFSHIQDIEIEDDRFLWVVTRNGLNRLDMKMDTFLQLTPRPSPTMPSPIGHDVFIDGKGRIWYTSDNRNLSRWLPKDKVFKTFKWKEWIIEGGHSKKTYYLNINRMIAKGNDKIWLCTNVGLFDYDIELDTFNYFPVPEGNFREFTDGYDDNRGSIWLNTGGGEVQIFDYNNDKWLLPFDEDGPDPDTDLFTQWAVIPVGENKVMAALTSGLSLWNTTTKSSGQIKSNSGQPWLLPGGKVVSLFKDREGIIWVGTTNGLAKIDPARQQFPTFSANWLNGRQVSYIWENPSDRKRFISVTGMGPLAVRDPRKVKSALLYHPSGTAFSDLLKMIADNKGNLWLMEFNRISRLSLADGKIYPVAIPDSLPDTGNRVQFNDATFDGVSSIYFSTDKAGLVRFDIEKESFHQIYVQDKSIESQIKSVEWDPSIKALWFSSRNGWLGRYHPGKETIYSFVHDPANPGSLASPMVVGSSRSPDGNMSFITEPGGISILDAGSKEEGTFRNFTTGDGLPVNLFARIQADDKGRLWLLHKGGLCLFDPKTGFVKEFDEKYGLEFPTMSTRFSKTEDGFILLGIKDGYLRFHPDSLFENTFPPNPTLTSVRVAGTEYLPVLVSRNYQLRVPYNQNNLEIQFATLNFIESEHNKTRFRLLGEETVWRNGRGSETVIYPKLDPGKYRFQLTAINSSGLEKAYTHELKLTITPHFTQTLWFRVMVIAIFLFTVYGLYRLRINQMLKVQKLRNKIAADLHDDVASTISSITFYSDYAQENTPDDNPKVRSTLRKISESARESLEIMREIVWAIQSDKDTFIHLRQQMKDFARPACEAKNIRFNWTEHHIPEKWQMSLVFRRNVYLIFKEAINNALKYADCSMIDVGLSRKGKKFILHIHDNGKGMDPGQPHSGNGIKNMKLRAEEIRGTISLLSSPGNGTEVKFEVTAW